MITRQRGETCSLEGRVRKLQNKIKSMHNEHMDKLSKMEREHASTVKELKRLMDPDTDVAAEMDELRTDKRKLAQRVEELEKMLIRKSVSLMGALQACDDIMIEDQRIESELQHLSPPTSPTLKPSLRRTSSSGLRERVKAFQQKRKLQRQSSSHTSSLSSNQSMSDVMMFCGSGTPK